MRQLFSFRLVAMMFVLLLCLANVVNSEVSIQTESTNENLIKSGNSKDHEKVSLITTKHHTQEQSSPSPLDVTVKNIDLIITSPKHELQIVTNRSNAEVKLSFSENTTALIKELKTTVENLIAHLDAVKSKSKEDKTRRALSGSMYDIFPRILRKKRDAENKTEVNTDSSIITVSIITEEANVENVTEATINTENKTKENETDYDWLNNDSNSTDVDNKDNKNETASGRRSFNSDMEIAKVVHSRLLSYVHEHISDTMNKIDSLKAIKNSYATNNMFNMGYILANIDLIEMNLRKLNEGIKENNKEWTEAHILDVFDKVKYTNTVVTSLMTALKSVIYASSGTKLITNVQNVYGK